MLVFAEAMAIFLADRQGPEGVEGSGGERQARASLSRDERGSGMWHQALVPDLSISCQTL